MCLPTPEVGSAQDEFRDRIREIVEEETDEPMEEASPRKLRKSKKYRLNAWEEITKTKIPVEFGHLLEIPAFRQQVRKGLGTVGPGYEVTEVNTAQTSE